MMQLNNNKRVVIQAGVALSFSMIALSGCQSPTSTPSLGTNSPAGEAPALAGQEQSAEPGMAKYVASPEVLKAAGATASVNAQNAKNGIDGNASSCWDSQTANKPTYQIELAASAELSELSLKATPNVGTYSVETSADGKTWQSALTGQKNTTWSVESKKLPDGTKGKFVRLSFDNGGKKVMVFEATVRGGKSSGAPAAKPDPAPSAGPVAPGAPATPPVAAPGGSSGTTITVDTKQVLHKATSHILGTNRNHVTSDFPNGAAKLEKLKELQPNWGEGKYLYRLGHGPTDGRNDYKYMTGYHFEQNWDKKGGYPYDDIREGLKEANALGADQMHVINFGTGSADEAGRYVSFLNKASDANRKAHPFAQQNVRMFELGNEIAWSMVRGHSTNAPNDVAYAKRAKEFAQQMRANSDVPIQIGANVSINSNFEGNGWSGGANTIKNVLSIMGKDVDFLIFHGYPSWPLWIKGDMKTVIAQNEWTRQKIEKEIKPAIKQYGGGRDIYLANTEFFTHMYNQVKQSRGMFGALYSADTLTLAMNEDIRTAVQFCFEHKDLADASFFIGNDPNNTTAIFKFNKMLAKHWGNNIVATSAQQMPSVNVKGASTSVDLPRLAYTAATAGNKVYVMVTNRLDDADVKSNIDVGFKPSSVKAYEVAGSWDADNGTEKTIDNPSLKGYNFKKSSITIFELTR